jgi:3-oxosteroid 1-dehydrogenase
LKERKIKSRDFTADVIAVGTGGGGMTAALVTAKAGLVTIIIEKTEFYSRSTAPSGGGIWVPNNYLPQRDGLEDSFEKARTYLQHAVGNRTPQSLQDTYLENAPEMVKYLVSNSYVHLNRAIGHPDYYPERPAGMTYSRAIEVLPLN